MGNLGRDDRGHAKGAADRGDDIHSYGCRIGRCISRQIVDVRATKPE